MPKAEAADNSELPLSVAGPLDEILRQEIRQSGAIPFSRFMELALYHPLHGYYRCGKDPFGRCGDFFTAEQLPSFGEMIAEAVGRSGKRHVLELGAGRRDLRSALAKYDYRGLDWDDPFLPERFSGFVIANEFFDALPFHLLERRGDEWFELWVDWRAGALTWQRCPLTSPHLADYAERYGCVHSGDAVLEVNLAMNDWLQNLSKHCAGAVCLIVDYGYAAPELVRFPQGSVLAYREHAALEDVLRMPGRQDITAHVNFTELLRLSRQLGFRVIFEGSLRLWALRQEMSRALRSRLENDVEWRLGWKQLVFGMGETFRVVQLEI